MEQGNGPDSSPEAMSSRQVQKQNKTGHQLRQRTQRSQVQKGWAKVRQASSREDGKRGRQSCPAQEADRATAGTGSTLSDTAEGPPGALVAEPETETPPPVQTRMRVWEAGSAWAAPGSEGPHVSPAEGPSRRDSAVTPRRLESCASLSKPHHWPEPVPA